jgi:hypothetical protein
MQNEKVETIVFMVLIAGRTELNALLSMLLDSGIHIIHTLYGKGTVKANYLQNTFGLIPEEKKVVITCLSTQAKADAVLELLVEKFHFNEPNTGIAFTVPISRVSF